MGMGHGNASAGAQLAPKLPMPDSRVPGTPALLVAGESHCRREADYLT